MAPEIPVDPTSLKALRGLCEAYPSLAKRWENSTAIDGILGDFGPPPPPTAQTVSSNDDTTTAHWSSMAAFDDGIVTGLDLGGMRLRSLEPALLSDLAPSLVTLNLANTDLPLTEQARAAICQLGKLEVLCLGGNGINDERVADMADIVTKCGKSLTRLDLRYNDLGLKGIQTLCRAIVDGQCEKLSCLHLEGNKVGDDGCQHIAEALGNSYISELYLGDNGIGPAGAAHFANALAPNATKLEKLFLEGNQIKAEGAEAFANALEGLWTKGEDGAGISLKHLYCDNNGVGKDGMKRLALALRSPTAVGDGL